MSSDEQRVYFSYNISLPLEELADHIYWSLSEDQAAFLVQKLDEKFASYEYSEKLYEFYKNEHKKMKEELADEQ